MPKRTDPYILILKKLDHQLLMKVLDLLTKKTHLIILERLLLKKFHSKESSKFRYKNPIPESVEESSTNSKSPTSSTMKPLTFSSINVIKKESQIYLEYIHTSSF